MINLVAGAAAAAVLAAGAVNPDQFEGLASDSFAAWSYGYGSVKVTGSVRTLLVQTRYTTPTAFNGNPVPVAYSIHTLAIDCAAKTTTFINGDNYSASGVLLYAANPSAPTPWSDATPGLQDFVTQVCATDWSKMQ
ncbi:MAG: hypothetical protein Q8L23_10160 [Caulobacter sp.]|nr:hypothetical protein [Caulobacter sp.]